MLETSSNIGSSLDADMETQVTEITEGKKEHFLQN
jgi:hypothetical protein